jgi:hypothetical protein
VQACRDCGFRVGEDAIFADEGFVDLSERNSNGCQRECVVGPGGLPIFRLGHCQHGRGHVGLDDERVIVGGDDAAGGGVGSFQALNLKVQVLRNATK